MDLYFKNPLFTDEPIQITVRLGTKWADIRGFLDVKKTGEPDKWIRTVEAIYTEVCPFNGIPDNWLKYEHDPLCQHMDGLKSALKEAYGDKFDEDELVTVVFMFVD